MREQFPWFLDPTEEELQRLWEEAAFCFDANVLLNLYRVDEETTEDYFKIFRELGDRIFLPHEAANQFFLNRREVIRTEQNSFSAAKERVEEWVQNRKDFDRIKDRLRGGDIGQIIEDEIESVFEEREDYEEEVEAVKEDLIAQVEDLEERFTPTGTTRANAEEDEILEGLMEIFEGKTGSELDEDIAELKKEAQARYKAEKPPGYEDYDGEDEVSRGECEDFIIWKQLMEFAEREDEDVLFITDDGKFDWWEKDDDYDFIRPRHELLREFRKETGQTFWMLTAEQMTDNAYERLGVEVSDKSIEQTGKVSNPPSVQYKDLFGSRPLGEKDTGGHDASRANLIERHYRELDKARKETDRIRQLVIDEEWKQATDLFWDKDVEILSAIRAAEEECPPLESEYSRKYVFGYFSTISNAIQDRDKREALSHLDDIVSDLGRMSDILKEKRNISAHSTEGMKTGRQ